jgi:hypothetical protein
MHDLKYTSPSRVHKRFYDLINSTLITLLLKRPHLVKTLNRFINSR